MNRLVEARDIAIAAAAEIGRGRPYVTEYGNPAVDIGHGIVLGYCAIKGWAVWYHHNGADGVALATGSTPTEAMAAAAARCAVDRRRVIAYCCAVDDAAAQFATALEPMLEAER